LGQEIKDVDFRSNGDSTKSETHDAEDIDSTERNDVPNTSQLDIHASINQTQQETRASDSSDILMESSTTYSVNENESIE
jgi:hypothetical protein